MGRNPAWTLTSVISAIFAQFFLESFLFFFFFKLIIFPLWTLCMHFVYHAYIYIYILTGTSSLFQIYSSGELHHFIDGFNEDKSNWMRYVNPGYSVQEQNLAACQNGMNIYFYTIKPIPANQELLVWYCRDFAERLHYPSSRELTMMNLSKCITV